MGCLFAVFVDPRRFPGSLPAAADALELVGSLESELTVYSPASHLSEVNRRADREKVTVSANLAELLRVSLELFAATGGAFDVTAGPLSKVWGFHARRPAVPTAQQIARALECVGSHWIDFDQNARTVQFQIPGIEINLASIGKGYALDRCDQAMRERGLTDFLLHGGQSSVLARGCQTAAEPEHGWIIGLVHPIMPQERIGLVRLIDRALGTSGCQRQSLIHRGQRLGHVIDPRTGWPVTHTLSATVLAPTAALADALATAFSVMSVKEVQSYCQTRPEISAIITTPNDGDPAAPFMHVFNLREMEWQPISRESAVEVARTNQTIEK
jgi:thiamine biosynthesis lipoprotein